MIPYLAGGSAIAALLLAVFFYKNVAAASPGDDRMIFLMTEIQKGARAFLKKEYTWVAFFIGALAIILAIVITPLASVTYVLGALLSAGAGYVGMTVATMANARTAEAAKQGPGKALPIAFRGGAVMGFTVAGLALLGLVAIYLVFVTWMEVDDAFEIVTAFGLGASSIALFSRVGGGIYTKAADVGADLVGKVEAGIPEDDPRNPATIADNVGDNVGDVAGMGADLFESYAGSIIAPISLVAFAMGLSADKAGATELVQNGGYSTIALLMFPLAIAFVGMVASIFGSFFVRGGDSTDSHALSRALHMGTNVAMAITAVATVGDERETLKVHTALSAVAVVFAEPVTVIPSLLREAKPDPTFINPPPSASERITAEIMMVTALRRSTVIIGLSFSCVMSLSYQLDSTQTRKFLKVNTPEAI